MLPVTEASQLLMHKIIAHLDAVEVHVQQFQKIRFVFHRKSAPKLCPGVACEK